jgi:multidrug efflux pump subunit AcrB
MGPAEFAIKNRLMSFIVITLALIGGWQAYQTMPRFEDPEFTIRQAVVITPYPGATPEEVSNEVTEALETAIQQLQEVKEIRSVSSTGMSRITVEIKYEFSRTKDELQIIWGKLRNKVEDAQRSLPPGAGRTIVDDDFGDVYGLYYLITGNGFTPAELHSYAKRLRTELLVVEGVAKVALNGVQSEAIYVEISRERAAALGVSVGRVYDDLARQNSVVSAGSVKIGNRRLVIEPTGRIDSVSAIENVVVSTADSGSLLYLRDIASVRRAYRTPDLMVRYNGRPAIGLGVSNVTGANVVQMGQAIDVLLAEEEARRPLGIELHEYYHQGKVVDAAVQDFALNVLLALVIVLVTLLIFMGLRSGIVIGAVLLLTIAATLPIMNIMGIPMHRISLGALIIALGMLVDNAIVVTEGILVGVQQGGRKLDIAREVVSRTKWPLLGGTVVGVLAFAPIGLAPGDTAEYTGHLFWVVMISLLLSWVFGITAVPLFADLLFAERAEAHGNRGRESRFTAGYKRFMQLVLARRWVTVSIAIGLFGVSMWGFRFVKEGFFPASTTPQIVVDYWLPEGTHISQTEADVVAIEEWIMGLDGVAGVQALVGQGGLRFMLVYPPEPPNSAYGHFLIQTEDYGQISRLMPQIQQFLDEQYPDAQAKVWQFQLGPGGGSKIEAAFSGADPIVLRRLANEAKAIMAAEGRAISIQDDWRQLVSVIHPVYSETRGRRLGISREDVANALQRNFSGSNVGVYREGDELIPIIARAPAQERSDAENMGEIRVASQLSGRSVPLSETVDSFQTSWRNSQLRRVDRVWTIKAQCDPLPEELASALLQRLRPEIEALELPEGYRLDWDGEYGDSTEANGNLATTLPLGFLSMVLVIVVLFNALRQPLIIWLVVPLALIGVVLGLVLTETPLEFMAILGLLSLSGLLIKNAIVLVAQMDLEISEGKPRYEAVIDSATSRVRPVSMGALTTVLGVMPLLWDPFFESMAVVLVFGLTFATLLTLVIVPALYAIFFGVQANETT